MRDKFFIGYIIYNNSQKFIKKTSLGGGHTLLSVLDDVPDFGLECFLFGLRELHDVQHDP